MLKRPSTGIGVGRLQFFHILFVGLWAKGLGYGEASKAPKPRVENLSRVLLTAQRVSTSLNFAS